LSLLELGAASGYSMLAIDRPGYGASASLAPRSGDEEAELLLTMLDYFAAEHEIGAGAFVMGHSAGTKTALTMAADPVRGPRLLGVEGSGVGVEFSVAFLAAREAGRHYSTLAWGSSALYPPGAREALVRVRTSRPDQEGGRNWPERVRRLASTIGIPVHITLAEEEHFYPTHSDELEALAALFTASPLVEVVLEPRCGHNLSVSWAARAYHLKVLAFVEQCMLLRRLTPA
jgi:pimeloyl-ACP methyl ester carboxylesterase